MEEKNCRVCGSEFTFFLDLGEMPAANALIREEDLDKEEYKYHLGACFCENCKMVQLLEVPPYEKYIIPNSEGKRNYLFFSSTSEFMKKHFAEYAKEMRDKFMKEGEMIIDIGSNDGILLQAEALKDVKVLGVEPSHNTAEVARGKGVETITDFFTEELAKKIVEEKGKAKVIVSANVILNIADLHEVMKGVNELLDEGGVFVFQDPYMPEILDKNAFDQFYDEHVYYFSIMSLANLARMYDMEVFNVSKHEVHGGSMRVYMKRKSDPKEVSESVKKALDLEKEMGLDKKETYIQFAERVKELREKLVYEVKKLKEDGKKIVGYAASSKGNIVLNYCNLGNDVVDYISDNTPEKQGLYSPGMHIPIVNPEKFQEDQPDYALMLAWNHSKEILEKEKEFREKGGKFIVYIPEFQIV